MSDPMQPIRGIRDRAKADLALFRQFSCDTNLVGLAGLLESGPSLIERMEAVIEQAEKLIADYERDHGVPE